MPAVPKFLKCWNTPQTLTIVDGRLGGLFWVLRVAVLVFVLVRLFTPGSTGYSSIEIPSGYPTFWLESGNLSQDQNLSATPTWCNNAAMDYHYKETTSGGGDYWNERNIGCVNLHYGDMVQVTAQDAFAVSYMKVMHTRSMPCGVSDGRGSCSIISGITGSRTVKEDRVNDRAGGYTCTCGKLQDNFIMGVDKMELHVQHAFHAEASGINGRSFVKGRCEETRTIKTCIKDPSKRDDSDCESPMSESSFSKCCLMEFSPGQTMALPVSRWLDAAGISLDGANTGVEPDVRGPARRLTSSCDAAAAGRLPVRRLTGVKLRLMMKYYGDEADDNFRCEIDVKHEDSWTSMGSKVTYRNFNGLDDTEYYDNYRRGIAFSFEPTGLVTRFDWQKLLNTIVAGLVFLGFVDTIVGLVAFQLLPEKGVYGKARAQELSYSNALAKFGINTALACQAFKMWDKNPGSAGPPSISRDELADVFKGPFEDKIAEQFADVVITEALKGGDGSKDLKCSDLVRLMSTGLVTTERLQSHAEQAAGDGSSKVAPEKVGLAGETA